MVRLVLLLFRPGSATGGNPDPSALPASYWNSIQLNPFLSLTLTLCLSHSVDTTHQNNYYDLVKCLAVIRTGEVDYLTEGLPSAIPLHTHHSQLFCTPWLMAERFHWCCTTQTCTDKGMALLLASTLDLCQEIATIVTVVWHDFLFVPDFCLKEYWHFHFHRIERCSFDRRAVHPYKYCPSMSQLSRESCWWKHCLFDYFLQLCSVYKEQKLLFKAHCIVVVKFIYLSS